MLIVFKSDNTRQREGFRVSYALNNHEVAQQIPKVSPQYCEQGRLVEVIHPEGVVESGGESPQFDADPDPGMTYMGGMRCLGPS